MSSGPWHVLHVVSNHEKRVSQHLASRSVDHYLPLYSEKIKWTDRSVITERPLFSGYVFARFTRAERLSVVTIPGLIRDLGEEAWNLVSDEELSRIRSGLATG
jgi:transcription antitermination factor NusG